MFCQTRNKAMKGAPKNWNIPCPVIGGIFMFIFIASNLFEITFINQPTSQSTNHMQPPKFNGNFNHNSDKK